MEQDYLAASDFILNHRGDPTGLVFEDVAADPVADQETRQSLADLVAPSTARSTSTARASTSRDWSPPALRSATGCRASTRTRSSPAPCPTRRSTASSRRDLRLASDRLQQLGALWGLAQYGEEIGALLEALGLPDHPCADADNDGRDNFSEWLRATDATTRDVLWQNFTHQLIAPGQNEAQLTFIRRKDLRDWEVTVAVSDDIEPGIHRHPGGNDRHPRRQR